MKATNIEKNMNQEYILTAADGIRKISWDNTQHVLVGTLLTTPTVGQAVIRPLSAEERMEYISIRQKERHIKKIAAATEAAAEKKEAEKRAARQERQNMLSDEKMDRIVAEQERAELRQLRDELKKLEPKLPEQKPEKTSGRPGDEFADYRRMLVESIRDARADAERRSYAAAAQFDALCAELNDLDAQINALRSTPKPEAPAKESVEPIGKPDDTAKADLEEDRKVCNSKRLIEVLKSLHIPQAAIDALVAEYTVTDIRKIVFAEAKDALTLIKGIGEKRADVIIKALTGRIPEPLAIAKLTAEVRESLKAEIREKAKGFSCRTYEPDELWREVAPQLKELSVYRPRSEAYLQGIAGGNQERFEELMSEEDVRRESALNKLDELKAKIFTDHPLTVRQKEGRVIRLSKSMMSAVLGIDCDATDVTSKLCVVRHDIQSTFMFDLSLFSADKDEAAELRDQFTADIENQLLKYGVRVVYEDGLGINYGGVGASAAHQKKDALLMAQTRLMKKHQDFLWYGKSVDEFATKLTTDGASFWKARANLLRPLMKPFATKDGRVISAFRVLVVKDSKKNYEILNGRKIGKDKETGRMYKDGRFVEPVILGDGAMLSLVPLEFQGQCSSTLFKGYLADGSSSIVAVCKKHGMSVEDFMNKKVEGIDGQMHRIGDFDVICGEGCWKGDKVFGSYTEYTTWLQKMAVKYNGCDSLYLLRQSEEIEDEEKIRRLTRTLEQQWMFMSTAERLALTKKARKQLKKLKTFSGAQKRLAAIWKDKTGEELTDVEKLFRECPWLIASPAMQDYLKGQWERKQIAAAAGKFVTEGQYPYIMQDPVALFEVWALGMNPDDPTLGVLKEGEVSCADVPTGRKLLCVRFPANFLTAQVKVNRACKEEFASMNNVMVLSIHDLILIAQDGDVDGDEMCVIYNRLAIRLTERMQRMFNPPVILFAHGNKAPKTVAGSKDAFIRKLSDALWRAKRFDSVGLYANLAMKCAYLAAIAYNAKDMKSMEKYLLWMSAASTGAIMALDQVKGNDVDLNLINWLNNISDSVRKAFQQIAQEMGFEYAEAKRKVNPFIQYYCALDKRDPIDMDRCLPMNEENFLDLCTDLVLRDTGKWENFDFEGVVWNPAAADHVFCGDSLDISVCKGYVTKEMKSVLSANWFKLAPKTQQEKDSDKTIETLMKIKRGELIGFKELILLLWRNEASMAQTMDGRNLFEKKEEYLAACRQILKLFVDKSPEWKTKKGTGVVPGHVFSLAEKMNILLSKAIRDALELRKGNGLDANKGSYAWFIIRLFAKALLERAKANKVPNARFFGATIPIEDLMIEIEDEETEDDEELYLPDEQEKPEVRVSGFETPECTDEPAYSDEELAQRLAEYDAYAESMGDW